MFHTLHFSYLPSTHKEALLNIDQFEGQHILITTDEQSQGVGRKGQPWLSSKGENLLATFIFPTPLHDLAHLAQLLSYSALQLVESYDLKPLFKWPNDLLIDDKKLAGVIVEIHGSTTIASIGLNVNMSRSELEKIDQPATSLKEELHHPIDLSECKKKLISQFERNLLLFCREGFAPFTLYFASKLVK